MKCQECGERNPDGALFCAHCGASLGETPPSEASIRCSVCGADIPEKEKSCMACGATPNRRDKHQGRQEHRSHQAKRNRKQDRHRTARFKWTPATIAFALLGGVLGLITLLELTVKEEPVAPPPFVETALRDPALESKVLAIASKFICSCGTCGEKPLETCTCNTAAEERQFIRNYLQQGQTPEQIIAALNSTYGWLKPEFAAKYDSLNAIRTRLNQSVAAAPTQTTFSELAMKKNSAGRVATSSDGEEILSHFRCPCGQCGMDELKECTCTHPRGAKEVKAFVQSKISEGKYSVAQLVEEIDAKYGGRKF